MGEGIESFCHVDCNNSSTDVVVVAVANSFYYIYKAFLCEAGVVKGTQA
jgi:hypothetical protein